MNFIWIGIVKSRWPLAIFILLGLFLIFVFRMEIGCSLGKPYYCWALGDKYLSLDAYDLGKAEKYYLKGRAAGDISPYVSYQLGRVYFLQGRFSEAEKVLAEALATAPNFDQALYMAGLVDAFSGELESAEARFRGYVKRRPEVWAGWNDLSWVQLKKGDYPEAESTADEGLKRFPGNPWLQNQKALPLLSQGRLREALDYFELALSGFEALAPEDWAAAYPGNSFADRDSGYKKVLEALRANIRLAREKLSTESSAF